ncbi:Lrp/AsnC family transcriptional regulator [Jatrophihabitans telluris]|uniref:Lrp/AsnC family transcriptional regulator n=1 Tax=Jatrophihabitans telluris TaxID=2038343 RepID=A0ABY4QZ19_9ACTN|nr:Lrp/AsnC family transcriptional regulator [Jatrophihabitans telluris]UQX88763.1 Lrp/AsnC family transcriptional regulator [Jatrophihabitans telluris]
MASDMSLPGASVAAEDQPAAMDETDRRIVDALRADGRLSMRALAERLHISRANAYARAERLHQAGVITGYSATINPRRYGYGLSAYVYLRISQHSWQEMRRRVMEIPEVEHGSLVSGEFDIVLLVRTRDTATLRDLVLSRLQAMPDVLGTQTVLIFDELAPVRE